MGSRIERDGTVRAGSVPKCGADSTATDRFFTAHAALEIAPPALRPTPVVVHVAPALPPDAPPLTAVEVHRPSRSVLVTGDRATRITPGMWLHELAHLLMLGEQPRARPARSLHAAIEEGVADYYAACVQGSPGLSAGGEGGAARELGARPGGISAGWEALAIPDRRFDEHRFGLDLATRLWREEPRVGPLLEDSLECVARARFGAEPLPPRRMVRALIDACPKRSRDRIAAVLAAWLPRGLRPGD